MTHNLLPGYSAPRFPFDTETTIKNRGEGAVGSHQGSPFFPTNRIVAWGEILDGVYGGVHECCSGSGAPWWLQLAATGSPARVVAHNAVFDLLYTMKTWPELFQKALPNLYVWCTQQAEYMLSGQTLQMPSLDLVAEMRGFPLKDDKIKAYWKAGVDTDMIPADELMDYLRQDVENVGGIAEQQWEEAEENGMLPLMLYKMDDILATAISTWNGMKFSLERALELSEEIRGKSVEAHAAIVREGAAFFKEGFEFNPGSPKQLSALLFGGEYDVMEDVEVLDEAGEVVRYKGGARKGEVKTRKEKRTYHTEGLGLPPPDKTTVHGYSTDDSVLESLDHPLVQALRDYRSLTKDLETYYVGYSQLVFPDGCLHPNLNNEIAATGRQTCSAPNLQNTSKQED